MNRSARGGRLIGFLRSGFVRTAAQALLLLGGVEAASRIVHGNVRPMIPFVVDHDGGPRLAPDMDMAVRLPGRDSIRLTTDALGGRIEPGGAGPPRILVAGDSQLLGWGLDARQSLGPVLGTALLGSPGGAVTLAAAGADPETLVPWARDYRRAGAERLRLKVIGLNLGNDLDEMILGRALPAAPGPSQRIVEWLTLHSFAFMDLSMAMARLSGKHEGIPPGADPVLFMLDDAERTDLADGAAQAMRNLTAALPPADRTVVLLIPNDTQVAPAEFEKYRPAYPDEQTFLAWRRNVPLAKARLDAIADRVSRDLAGGDLIVLDLRAVLAGHDPRKVFDRHSHHLTAYGTRLAAQAILARLGR